MWCRLQQRVLYEIEERKDQYDGELWLRQTKRADARVRGVGS